MKSPIIWTLLALVLVSVVVSMMNHALETVAARMGAAVVERWTENTTEPFDNW